MVAEGRAGPVWFAMAVVLLTPVKRTYAKIAKDETSQQNWWTYTRTYMPLNSQRRAG